MTKKEIMAKLDEAGIEYDPTAKIADLSNLLPADDASIESSDTEEEIDPIEEVEEQLTLDEEMDRLAAEEAAKKAELPVLTKAEQKAAYIKIITNYKKQNPRKYAIKKASFEKKLASFND